MHGLKLYVTLKDINDYIKTKIDSKYQGYTFIPFKTEINENDLSIDITLISVDNVEDKNGRRYKLNLQSDEPTVLNPRDYATNKICESDLDHQWECCGVSTEESTYMCKICGKIKHDTHPRQGDIVFTAL